MKLASSVRAARTVTHNNRTDIAVWCGGYRWGPGVIVRTPDYERQANPGDVVVEFVTGEFEVWPAGSPLASLGRHPSSRRKP